MEDENEQATSAAARQLSHFDHSYKAYLHTVWGPALEVFGQFKGERRNINLNCTSDNLEME